MSEKAVPVVERAAAPATPPEDVSTPKAAKLSYSAADLPAPINSYEQYVRANLIEARATRGAIERLAAAVEALVAAQASPGNSEGKSK